MPRRSQISCNADSTTSSTGLAPWVSPSAPFTVSTRRNGVFDSMKSFFTLVTILFFTAGCAHTTTTAVENVVNSSSETNTNVNVTLTAPAVAEPAEAPDSTSEETPQETAASTPEDQTEDQTSEPEAAPTTSETTEPDETTPDTPAPEAAPTTQAESTKKTSSTESHTEDAKISVTLQIVSPNDVEDYSISIIDGATVEDVMQKAKGRGLNYDTKGYGSTGRYVTSINGLKEDRQQGFYWIYYVNGTAATAGISTQTVTDGMQIKWNYEKEF